METAGKTFSNAVASTRLTKAMIEDAKKVLNLIWLPYVEALSEADAQATHMASMGSIWAASSRNYVSYTELLVWLGM
ncbi:MAG: hypothetical protein QXI32_06350 [Candidatus Bathyarchaeia archaeon]